MASISLFYPSPVPLAKIKISNARHPISLLNNRSAADSISLVSGPRFLTTTTRKRRNMTVFSAAAIASPQTLQLVSAVSSAVLMLVRGTTIQKSFLVPLFALQAPAAVISWIKGEYGIWVAFLALLVRLFFSIPGDLELPLQTMLLVFVAPYQMMNLRGSQAGAIISLAIAGYLTFQHFSKAGSLRTAFDLVHVIATLAVICIAVVSCVFCF